MLKFFKVYLMRNLFTTQPPYRNIENKLRLHFIDNIQFSRPVNGITHIRCGISIYLQIRKNIDLILMSPILCYFNDIYKFNDH